MGWWLIDLQLYGLIFLGSTNAFSAMVSATVMFLQTSCAMPQAILLFRGRDQLPDRFFKLGALGPFVNATAVAWVVLVDILACFPTTLPVSAQNMNYMSVVAVGLVSMVMIFWFTTRKRHFKGPSVDFVRMAARRQAAIDTSITKSGRTAV
jgi:choline transport protein